MFFTLGAISLPPALSAKRESSYISKSSTSSTESDYSDDSIILYYFSDKKKSVATSSMSPPTKPSKPLESASNPPPTAYSPSQNPIYSFSSFHKHTSPSPNPTTTIHDSIPTPFPDNQTPNQSHKKQIQIPTPNDEITFQTIMNQIPKQSTMNHVPNQYSINLVPISTNYQIPNLTPINQIPNYISISSNPVTTPVILKPIISPSVQIPSYVATNQIPISSSTNQIPKHTRPTQIPISAYYHHQKSDPAPSPIPTHQNPMPSPTPTSTNPIPTPIPSSISTLADQKPLPTPINPKPTPTNPKPTFSPSSQLPTPTSQQPMPTPTPTPTNKKRDPHVVSSIMKSFVVSARGALPSSPTQQDIEFLNCCRFFEYALKKRSISNLRDAFSEFVRSEKYCSPSLTHSATSKRILKIRDYLGITEIMPIYSNPCCLRVEPTTEDYIIQRQVVYAVCKNIYNEFDFRILKSFIKGGNIIVEYSTRTAR